MKNQIFKVCAREIGKKELAEINKIHLKNFKSIKEKTLKSEDFSPTTNIYYLSDTKGKILAYGIANKGPSSQLGFLAWFASTESGKGYGGKLISFIEKDLKKMGARYIRVVSRNRFSAALCFYIKNKFKIIGTHLSSDDDLYIDLSKEL